MSSANFFDFSCFKNITLTDLSFLCLFDKSKEKDKFYEYFEKCIRELNPNDFNSVVRRNLIVIFDKMRINQKMLLNELNKLKQKMSDDAKNDEKIEKQSRGFPDQVRMMHYDHTLKNQIKKLQYDLKLASAKNKTCHEYAKKLQDIFFAKDAEINEMKKTLDEKDKVFAEIQKEKEKIIIESEMRLAAEKKKVEELEEKVAKMMERRKTFMQNFTKYDEITKEINSNDESVDRNLNAVFSRTAAYFAERNLMDVNENSMADSEKASIDEPPSKRSKFVA